MKETKVLLIISKYLIIKKENQRQQPQLLPLPRLLLLLLPFVVLRATQHNPVDTPFENARAVARCNIATKSANERIGVQEATNKNASDWERREKKGEQHHTKQFLLVPGSNCSLVKVHVFCNFAIANFTKHSGGVCVVHILYTCMYTLLTWYLYAGTCVQLDKFSNKLKNLQIFLSCTTCTLYNIIYR